MKRAKEKEIKTSTQLVDQEVLEASDVIRYDEPKIMLVDIGIETESKLRKEGFNIESGTFGKGYEAQRDEVCGVNGHLPFITEKDVVIVRLDAELELTGLNPLLEQKTSASDETVLITPRGKNYFDGRAIFAHYYKKEFEQVLESGGILIVFADARREEIYYMSEVRNGYAREPHRVDISNYQWVPGNISVNECATGKQVLINESVADIAQIAQAIIIGSENEMKYTCEFNVYENENRHVLLKNRLGEAISFIEKIGDGLLIVLPRFEDDYKPISNLIKEVLPEIKPNLFPDFVKNNWVDSEEYMFPMVKNLINKKEEVIKEYEEKVRAIENNIKAIKHQNEFLTNILISQGFDDFLVENVNKVLEHIGYTKIIDVDKITEGNRQEDLRILDNDRFTVIEIKGHKGNPTEDDCQALTKYISRNMKAEGRTDIHGILIVNHQRMLPPSKRKYPAYTDEQIADAVRDEYTLVTTWELFKAARLLQEGLITFEDIDTSLHTPGLFNAIPHSWKYLGGIERIFNRNQENNIVCFYLKADSIKKGDTIIIKSGNEFSKQVVTEMMINNENVEIAKKGDQLAVKIFNPISKRAQIYVI